MDEIFLAKSKQIDELTNCNSLQEMLDEAFSILGHPTLAHSMEYKLLANTNVKTDDPIWNEYISFGTVSKETIDFFQRENFIDIASNINSSAILDSPNLPYDRLFGKLFISNDIQVGCICTVACFTPFSPDDYILFEKFRQTICKKLSGKEDFLVYGKEYQKWLITTLIEGTFGSKTLFCPHVANLYEGLGEKIYLAVLDISSSKKYSSTEEYIERLKSINNDFKYFAYDDLIIVILSSKDTSNIQEVVNTYESIFTQDNVFAGRSESFDNLFEIKKYYEKAKQALKKGLSQNNPDKRIFE